jgi:fimbrial chaperone protein
MRRPCRHLLLGALALAALAARAAEFSVIPLSVDLDRSAKSTEVTVRNFAETPLRMQVEALAWQQDEQGADRYEPTEGLVYFPRVLEIPPRESRLVRVGVRAAPVSREDTYRLFIEELPPDAGAPVPAGASVRVLLRIGVPVFVAPLAPERKAELDAPAMGGGSASIRIFNAGNVRFRAQEVRLVGTGRNGETLFDHVFPERYFLAGAERRLKVDIPPDVCGRLVTLEATVKGDDVTLQRRTDVDPRSCR